MCLRIRSSTITNLVERSNIDGPKIEQPTSLVIDITTWIAIYLDKTRCKSVWSELDVR